jgi:hypothetical protein
MGETEMLRGLLTSSWPVVKLQTVASKLGAGIFGALILRHSELYLRTLNR